MINSLEELKRIKNFASSNRERKNKYISIIYSFIIEILRELNLYSKIKKEYVIYPYIIDIFINKYGIGIELDGKEHKKKIEYDSKRDSLFENLEILVLHFDYEYIDKYNTDLKIIIKNAILNRKDSKFNFLKIRENNRISSPKTVKKYISYGKALKIEKRKLKNSKDGYRLVCC